MKSDLHIFLDLDECLVSTVFSHNPKKNRSKIVFTSHGRTENYYSVLRPGALDFIKYCRGIAPTFILTAADADYAQEHNKIFSMGFKPNEIIGRDEYMRYRSGMFHDSVHATKIDQYPNSILVDNQGINQWGSENLRVKMKFLGIKEDRLVKSREYMGGNNPPNFKKEIDQIKIILDRIQKPE